MSANFTPEAPSFKTICYMNMQRLTNFPFIEADFDALTNYELLCKIVEYLNEVISNNNEQNETVTALYNAYVELQTYVNDYFDNLDVQEEINNKLDEMTEDGTLTNLIKNYVDPIYQAYENEINSDISEFKNIITNNITIQNSKINALENNTPIPVESVDDMLDTTKVYLLTTDGKWYYYDGNDWTIGGDYENIDGEEMIKSYDQLRKTNSTPLITTWYNKLIDGSGNLGNDSNIRLSSDLIELPVDSYLDIDLLVSDARCSVFFYDENKTYLNNIAYSADNIIYFKNKYIRLQFAYLDNSEVSVASVDTYLNINTINKKSNVECELENIFDISKSVNGFISANNGNITSNDSYETSDYIPVTKGDKITISPSVRKFLAYSAIGTSLAATYVNDESEGNYTYTATQNCYIRFSYRKTNKYITIAKYGETINDYYRYGYVKENLIDPSNVLSGKTIVACGDSFTQYTAAVGGDSTHTEANWSDEYNCYKTYPYWIAKRNNMNLYNEAVSGSTMTYLGTREDAFSKNRYKNLPKADYIILKFGINDDDTHQNAPIGTIDDNTNATFYGAWNVVMAYLIQNHPEAKIGIIISNGTTSEIDNATINIAKKWGVGYLNEGLGEDLYAWFRTARTDVDDSVKSTLLSRYSINPPSDTHPDVEWHKRESSAVEQWLRSL